MRGKIAFPVFLILFLTVLLFAVPAPGEGRLTSGEYEYYVLEDSSARIVSWLGEGTEAVVPAELDGHPVSVLGYAFYRNDTLTSVTLPDTLTEGNKAPFDQDAVMRLYIFGNSYPAENGYIYSVHVIPADKQRESGIPVMVPSRTQHLSGSDDFVTCYRHNISPSISCAAARAALLTYRDYGAGRSKLRTSKKISPRKGKNLFA